jgi:intraflagellar transport protein 88
MTSNKGAGYKDAKKFDPLNANINKLAPEEKTQVKSPEDQMKDNERQINTALEESSTLYTQNKLTLALEKAKDALNKDRSLRKLRETHNMVDQINTDLTFSVCLNLANMYEANKMFAEALKTYTLIVKNNN